MTPAPTQSSVLTALRAFLLSILPAGAEVVLAQDNRVPEPTADDFVTMTPLLMPRLSTNVHTVDPIAQTDTLTQPTQVTIQLDVHGPNSADNAQTISILFRDDYAAQFFQQQGGAASPFYADDPKQAPYLNDQQQVETRWVIDAVMQVNSAVTVPLQTANELTATAAPVEAAYPAT